MDRPIHRHPRTIALAAVGIGLGSLLGWLALRGTDWLAVGTTLQRFPPLLGLAGLALVLAAASVRAARWQLLFIDQRVSVRRLFLIEMAAIGLNNISPVRVLSEPTQVGLLSMRDRLDPGTLLATMTAARAMDLLVTVLIVGVAMLYMPALLPFAPLVVLAAATSAAAMGFLFVTGLGGPVLPIIRRLPFAHRFGEAARALRARPARVCGSLALTALYCILFGLTGWLVGVGLGIPIAPQLAIFVVLAAEFFATSVPGPPTALGTFEFAVVFLLGLLAVPREIAVPFGILVHALIFLPPTVFTVFILPREGIRSAEHLLELLQGNKAPQV